MSDKPKGRFRTFLERKKISITPRAYFLDAMSAMALGLFSSLLIGTIFGTLYTWTNFAFLDTVAGYAKQATGAALGIAIAYSLHAPAFVLFSAAAVGIAGNMLGGPVGAYLATVVATELGKAVSKETKVDLLVTPSVTIIAGTLVAMFVGPGVSAVMTAFGKFIMYATELQPLWMGMLVSATVGIVLTLPISSAALCVMLDLSGLAAGAATAGCCAQMIGFAFMSFRENRWGGLVAQGLGTSMLQMPNILRNPRIWIPTILTSLITGPLSTLVFKLENIPVGAGMGTCGLVGPLGILTAMPDGGTRMWVGIALLCFILPATLTMGFSWILERIGWIRPGDLKIDS
ncbi:MAG: PTS transporter subunit IIC [Eubacteriales bacterium]|jgi:uncharacterized membrane protein